MDGARLFTGFAGSGMVGAYRKFGGSMKHLIISVVAGIFLAGLGTAPLSAQTESGVRENKKQIKAWNAFADGLLRIHQHRLDTRNVRTLERLGGYARMPDFYREVDYVDTENGRLLSRIRWERERPDTAHSIEVYFYDKRGRLAVDYLAAYMPHHRKAPIQTLVNVHYRDSDLSSFRQFDASGNTIFERCEGDYFERRIDLYLDEEDMPPSQGVVPDDVYSACFGFLPVEPGKYLKPVSLVPELGETLPVEEDDGLTYEKLEREATDLGRRIATSPNDAGLYVKRGRNLFLLGRFEDAVGDFTTALDLDDDADAAYFGRGMALGRMGELDRSIADLGVYIQRHPESSLAYTKRGVRHIWKRNFERARRDLEMAVSLDINNAEAHDDLGVALVQLGQIDKALEHFLRAKSIEPGYQKVHHNLAMLHYITGDLERALPAVTEALRLRPASRGSLLLKGSILEGLGDHAEAAAARNKAEFLPEGNWSERSAVR